LTIQFRRPAGTSHDIAAAHTHIPQTPDMFSAKIPPHLNRVCSVLGILPGKNA